MLEVKLALVAREVFSDFDKKLAYDCRYSKEYNLESTSFDFEKVAFFCFFQTFFFRDTLRKNLLRLSTLAAARINFSMFLTLQMVFKLNMHIIGKRLKSNKRLELGKECLLGLQMSTMFLVY